MVSHNIKIGQELSLELLIKIQKEDTLVKIKNKALNLLKYRDRSKKELDKSLSYKGFDRQDISLVLDDLELKGFLDDEKFARHLALHLVSVKMLGRIAVINRFRKHGVDLNILNAILDKLYDEYEPSSLIERIIEKKTKFKKNKEKNNKQLLNHLKRKGFTWSEISNSLN
ncbi:MAG: regulatory protein RecX [Candidatus Neomarinimicrobiota bacterium]